MQVGDNLVRHRDDAIEVRLIVLDLEDGQHVIVDGAAAPGDPDTQHLSGDRVDLFDQMRRRDVDVVNRVLI